jgi:hypothetical protein
MDLLSQYKRRPDLFCLTQLGSWETELVLNRRHFLKNLTETGLGSAVAGSSGMLLSGDEEQTRDLTFLLRVLEPSRPPQTGRINATDRTWEEWQRRTAELPPRFSQLPAQPFLPNLLAG